MMAREIAGECCGKSGRMTPGASGGAYGLAFVGTAVYFVVHATTFWMGVLGVLKALVWPAILMFKVFERLGM